MSRNGIGRVWHFGAAKALVNRTVQQIQNHHHNGNNKINNNNRNHEHYKLIKKFSLHHNINRKSGEQRY